MFRSWAAPAVGALIALGAALLAPVTMGRSSLSGPEGGFISRRLNARYVGPDGSDKSAAVAKATPLSLASADVNHDGYPDLAVGFASGGGGLVVIHLANPEAFSPRLPSSLEFPNQPTFRVAVLSGTGAAATAINNQGQVLGGTDWPSGGGGFVWTNGTITSLHTATNYYTVAKNYTVRWRSRFSE
jgi:probable HAF family extracellular repeat protein